MSDEVLKVEDLETDAGTIRVWTIDRAKNLNALNTAVLKRVHQEAEKIKVGANQFSTRGLIIKGAGDKAFAAGADIAEMKDMSASEAKAFSKHGHEAFRALETLPIPTIAAVNGFCLGGGLELAMGCDIIFASKVSKFGQPEASLGLIPGFGATARFVDRLGRAKALEYFYSSEMLNADEALDFGLIQRVGVEGADVFEEAKKFLEKVLKKNSSVALAKLKSVVDTLYVDKISQINEAEAEAFGACFETEDKRIGVEAFLNKKSPDFSGR